MPHIENDTIQETTSQEINPIKRDEKGRWVEGNPPGPGRPKGSTLKEYQAQKYRDMPDEQKDKELEKMSEELKWRMAEGNPHQTSDTLIELKPTPLLDAIRNNSSNPQNSEVKQEN